MKNYNAILNDTDDILAEDTGHVRHNKMTRKAKEKINFADVTGCHEIRTADNKTRIFVKPSQDIKEHLEQHQIRYPDAKIVK